jgi:hypothetical protein
MTAGEPTAIEAHELVALFHEAFATFLNEERENILSGTAEQNLCGRLALCMERRREARGIKGYFLDTEYNRKQQGKIKTIIDDDLQIVNIRCDLILHSRGRILPQDNLIVIEMKRAHHSDEEKRKDRMRLKAMTKATYDDIWSADGETHPEHVCRYSVGFYLELDAPENSFLIETYIGGQQVAKQHAAF